MTCSYICGSGIFMRVSHLVYIGHEFITDFPISDHGHSNACVSFFLWVFFRLRAWKKINKLFTGLGSVRTVKNCDLGLENDARGLRPLAAFSRPRSQFFTIRTDPKPVNNLYLRNDIWFIIFKTTMGFLYIFTTKFGYVNVNSQVFVTLHRSTRPFPGPHLKHRNYM